MRVRAWLTCHTFSSSYSSKASWNWAGVKPRETQRCSASAMRTNPPAPRPSAASSRTREKMTSAGRCVLQMRNQIFKNVNFKASRNFEWTYSKMAQSKACKHIRHIHIHIHKLHFLPVLNMRSCEQSSIKIKFYSFLQDMQETHKTALNQMTSGHVSLTESHI